MPAMQIPFAFDSTGEMKLFTYIIPLTGEKSLLNFFTVFPAFECVKMTDRLNKKEGGEKRSC